MGLKKSSEEAPNRVSEPVSFRLTLEGYRKLWILGEALEKSKSQVIEEMVSIFYNDAEKDYPREVKSATAAFERYLKEEQENRKKRKNSR